MKQNPVKEKIVNGQQDNTVVQRDAENINAENKKKDVKPNFTSADLKGKKVDGDPELERRV